MLFFILLPATAIQGAGILDEIPTVPPGSIIFNSSTELGCQYLFPATYALSYAHTLFNWARFSSWDTKEVLHQGHFLAMFQCEDIPTATPDMPGDTWLLECGDADLVTLEDAPIPASAIMNENEVELHNSTRSYCLERGKFARIDVRPHTGQCLELPPTLFSSQRFMVLVYTSAHFDNNGYETSRTGKLVESELTLDVKRLDRIDYKNGKHKNWLTRTSVLEYYVPKSERSQGFIDCTTSIAHFTIELTIAFIEIPQRKDGSG